jgi:serine/threonine-protein kinase
VVVQLLEPGTVVADYSIIETLGRGGISIVYRAVNLDSGAHVALKMLDKRFASDHRFLDRFAAEVETLGQLSHPNIVALFGHGFFDDTPWIAMELIEGITLDQLIHAIELSADQYLHLIREISQGLTYVHANGLLHGDVKPSNILVTRSGIVKIADFGIAHRLGTLAASEPTSGSARGTSCYMAPELFTHPAHVDYRADIFSLGVTFYKMFTKNLPSHPWKPASLLNHELPKGVDEALARALQEDPDRRYITVNEFCETLAPMFGGKRTPAGNYPEEWRSNSNTAAIAHHTAVPDSEPAERIDWRLVAICLGSGVALVCAALVFFFG